MKSVLSCIVLGIIMFFGCMQSTMAGFFNVHHEMENMQGISQEECCDTMHENCDESMHDCCESFFKYSNVSNNHDNEKIFTIKKIKYFYQIVDINSYQKWEYYVAQAPPILDYGMSHGENDYFHLVGIIKNNC